MCTPLCYGRGAPCLCCSLFFCCRAFTFFNGHDLFLRNMQYAYEHIHLSHMTRDYLVYKKKSRRREVRCTLQVYSAEFFSPSWSEHVWRQFFHHLSISSTLTPTTNYELLRYVMVILTILSTPQTSSHLPGACVPAPAGTHADLYMYIIHVFI